MMQKLEKIGKNIPYDYYYCSNYKTSEQELYTSIRRKNMTDMINDFLEYLKKRNIELQEQIDSNKELIEFIEKGGYIEWKQQK